MTQIIILAGLILTAVSCADRLRDPGADFPARTVFVNGNKYKFRIYVPDGLDSNAKVPVMLYLHGSGVRGDDNKTQLNDIAYYVERDQKKIPFIIVFPQCRSDKFWTGEMMDQAMAALDQTVKEFNGDKDRLYLAGYSMGGFGVWQAALTFPGKFAALVPVAGSIKLQNILPPEQMEVLSPTIRAAVNANDPYRAFAEYIGKTPVWAFHGGVDEVVSIEGSREIVKALKTSGNRNVNYTEFENVGHASVGKAFSEPGLFDWLLKQSLDAQK